MGKRKRGPKRSGMDGATAELDGCDAVLDDTEIMPDEALPVAAGGVAPAARPRPADEDDRDGCDVGAADSGVADIDATADEDLPAAAGGVG